ncbi:hypothetical protein PUNSTDRAFT_67847 [Punctularia strigosozonata HHB-11173 SS5]|uniref:uncharacterized protein n=1 Tax=Punctularia strigosozonata (strain HHB-11173) TaxID=741275 RepID=UPI0004416C0F|nr:uncharacterized protein PUNSTDRAFT_67847 [Punctularia strigosozonata HHB-11173 SS5]EIN09154.1 hypothetical protein PUNSTDRAFT_67847 [Punctularia strigosozonata HHB-11173 SS5]
MDLHGPVPVRTPEGYRYWHLIVDDCTRIYGLFLLRSKAEASFATLRPMGGEQARDAC